MEKATRNEHNDEARLLALDPSVDRRTTSILRNHDIEDRVRVAQDVKSLVSVWLTLLSKWQCIPNFVIEK
jgi:hypothetical protein